MKDLAEIDFETKPIEPGSYPPEPVGVAIAAPDRPNEYMAWGHPEGNNCSRETAIRRLREVYGRFAVVCHNAPFDLYVAAEHLLLPLPPEYHCTLTLAFLDNPYARDLRLKEYYDAKYQIKAREREKLFTWIKENIREARNRKELGEFIWRCPGNLVAPYAIGDVTRPKRLFRDLHRTILKDNMDEAYRREMAMLPVIIGMMKLGIPVDRKRLERDIQRWHGILKQVELRIAKRLKVRPEELNTENKESWSPDKIADALEAAGVMDLKAWGRKQNGKGSIAYDELKVAMKDKGLLAMFDMRGMLSTDLNTFMRPWLDYSQRDGRLHVCWNTTRRPGIDERRLVGARTGRMSSTPNLQNVPKEPPEAPPDLARYLKDVLAEFGYLPNMRDYLVPPSGGFLIQRDYNQQEFRILGHYEGGELCQAYRDDPNLDIHTAGQKTINAKLNTNYARKPIKNLGFGIIYGQGLGLTAAVMNVTVEEARFIRNLYLQEFVPGIAQVQRELRKRAAKKEPFYTWGGRRYFCEKPREFNGEIRTFEYKMLNTLIQGSAADCTKEAAIRAHAALGSGCLSLLVHDEFVGLAATESEARRSMARLREAMESVGVHGQPPTFKVPMTSEGKWSRRSWGTLKKFKEK